MGGGLGVEAGVGSRGRQGRQGRQGRRGRQGRQGRHRSSRRTKHRGLWVEFHPGIGDALLVAALVPALIAFGIWAGRRVGFDTPAVWATLSAGALLVPGYPMDLRRASNAYTGFSGLIRRTASGLVAHAWEIALMVAVFLWILRWISGRLD